MDDLKNLSFNEEIKNIKQEKNETQTD